MISRQATVERLQRRGACTGVRTGTRGVGMAGVAAGMLLAMTACIAEESALIVYSSLPGDLLDEVGRSFEVAHADADVRFVKLDDEAALAQLTKEKGSARADVWWGATEDLLARAAAVDLLAAPESGPVPLEGLGLDDPGGRWWATVASPLVLAFDPEQLTLGRTPRDWMDLHHPRWNGELTLLDPSVHAGTRALLFGIMLREARRTGVIDAGFDWLLRLDAVTVGYAPDVSGVEGWLRSGEASLTILPFHVVRQLEERSVVSWRLPESGSPVLVRGVGVVAGSEQPELAAAFARYVAGTESAAATGLATGWPLARKGGDFVGLQGYDDRLLGLRIWASAPDTLAIEGAEWIRRWTEDVRGRGAPIY